MNLLNEVYLSSMESLSKHDSFNHESIWRISYSSKSEYFCVTLYSISETENAKVIIVPCHGPCEYHDRYHKVNPVNATTSRNYFSWVISSYDDEILL